MPPTQAHHIDELVIGVGIGGADAAVSSVIDKLVPARRRGQLNLAINGTY